MEDYQTGWGIASYSMGLGLGLERFIANDKDNGLALLGLFAIPGACYLIGWENKILK